MVVGSRFERLGDEVRLKGQNVRFVTTISMHRLPILVVLSTWCFKSEQGRFVTTMSGIRHGLLAFLFAVVWWLAKGFV
jgi:hypothetical protein